jgi:uncharacterized protein (TIGR03086 family)
LFVLTHGRKDVSARSLLTTAAREAMTISISLENSGLDVSMMNEHAVIQTIITGGKRTGGGAMALETTYRRSVEFWKGTVSEVSDDWSKSTPCADWDVRALVNHVVSEDRWTRPLVEGRTIAEVGNALDGDLLGENPKGSASAAADEALTAVAERLPAGGKVHLSYGEEDIEEYIRQLVADHLIHGWDLAAGIGQNRNLDPELVEEVAEWFRDREEIYRSGGAIADRPESAAGGNPQADLLIAFGRNPNWTPRS